jgi:hypothetical protein
MRGLISVSGRRGFVGVVIVISAAAAAAVMLLAGGGAARGAVIGASGDETQPSAETVYPVGGGSGSGGPPNVLIVEDVALDFGAGVWMKDLVNATENGFSSGQNRSIAELLTNAGSLTWTGWHERIVTRTTGGGGGGGPGNDPPGFLFRENSLVLSANYGAGVVPLTQGVDYTVAPTQGPPGSGNGPDWETITITFAPHAVIEPGDILEIRKDIFEVFGDGNIWMPEEAARIGQFPIGVPEPGAAVFIGGAAAGAMVRRRRRHAHLRYAPGRSAAESRGFSA